LRSRSVELGARTLVMGVVNVTPDSFSDGGNFLSQDAASEHGLRLLDEGADILDVGGESTRPGVPLGTVTEEEELRRVLGVIRELRSMRPDVVISIDTYHATVARKVVEAGAEIINDVSGGTWDAAMLATAAELDCGVVLMHTRGKPEEWRSLPKLAANEVVPLVKSGLRKSAEAAMQLGIARENIVLDPGFGFGKRYEENFPLLAHFEQLAELGFPLLAGTSRKGFIGRTLRNGEEEAPVTERLYGTIATVAAAILAGAHIIRVHDVKPAVDAARVADEILKARS
jgi:dihydropteroate synthase